MGRGVGNSGFPPGPHFRGMKPKNFAPAPLEMLLLHPAWIHPLSKEPQTIQTPPNLVPCPPELPQCHFRCPGAARVPRGSAQGCSGYCRAIPRDAGLSLGVTIVTEQHLCSPAGNLLFHPTLRWTLSNSFLPLHKGNTKSSPRGPSSSTPSHTRFHPTKNQDPAREAASRNLQGVQEGSGWSFSLTQIYNCEWDKIRGFLTLVVNRSLSRLKTSNTLIFFNCKMPLLAVTLRLINMDSFFSALNVIITR